MSVESFNQLLNVARREKNERVLLDSNAYAEAQFWRGYCARPTIVPMATKKLDLYQIKSYSDASGHRWAYIMFDGFEDKKVSGAGQFPDIYANETILFKETYALYQLTLVLGPNTQNLVHCDNSALVSLYKKTRTTKNLVVNRYLELIHPQREKNDFLRVLISIF